MIVVDTDLLAAYLIRQPRSPLAHSLRGLDPDWRAPHLWRAEFLSVLNKHVRAKIMSPAQAQEVLGAALQTYSSIDMPVDLAAALPLAGATGASTYDAHFLALAQGLGCPLVTGEKRHPGAAQGLAISIEAFLKAHGTS